ncbi:hypothetical protein ACT5YR_06980 [Fructobacillus fructosus]|uniref:hypothetical protein n=1 Tax=Fructobacillus fructosus TaxID=1631 RepID=UPI004033AD03
MKNFVITFRLFDFKKNDGSRTKLYLVCEVNEKKFFEYSVTTNKEFASKFSRNETDIIIGSFADYLQNFFEVELAR